MGQKRGNALVAGAELNGCLQQGRARVDLENGAHLQSDRDQS